MSQFCWMGYFDCFSASKRNEAIRKPKNKRVTFAIIKMVDTISFSHKQALTHNNTIVCTKATTIFETLSGGSIFKTSARLLFFKKKVFFVILGCWWKWYLRKRASKGPLLKILSYSILHKEKTILNIWMISPFPLRPCFSNNTKWVFFHFSSAKKATHFVIILSKRGYLSVFRVFFRLLAQIVGLIWLFYSSKLPVSNNEMFVLGLLVLRSE